MSAESEYVMRWRCLDCGQVLERRVGATPDLGGPAQVRVFPCKRSTGEPEAVAWTVHFSRHELVSYREVPR